MNNTNSNNILCTRFAPSPTGLMHIGNIRSALITYLWARKNNAKFILRFDDTDTERSKQEFSNNIKEDLLWLGINPDKTIFQSKRNEIYCNWFSICLNANLVYECDETPEELEDLREKLKSQGKAPVFKFYSIKTSLESEQSSTTSDKKITKSEKPKYWRFKLPDLKITWKDLIKGEISINLRNVSDPVIRKSDSSFTYTFTSVIDDISEEVTHVIRGEDHTINTAVQQYMIETIKQKIISKPETDGNSKPTEQSTFDRESSQNIESLGNKSEIKWAHLPIILDNSGKVLSKRNGAKSIKEIREEGFLPETLISYITNLGKSQYIIGNMKEVLKAFDINYSSSQARFNQKEFLKTQQKILRNKIKEQNAYFQNKYKMSEKTLSLVREEIDFEHELEEWHDIFYKKIHFYRSDNENNTEKTDKIIFLEKEENEIWKNWIERNCEGRNRRDILKELRFVLTGRKFGPTLTDLLENIDIEVVNFRLFNRDS
ncbi:glutamate--tRNA ligase [Candidatus Nesciobacter abundans]|uniref:Glutamyl/glutaminyl-tRNA synthetase class Ib catalytic domain-containing protein n=1 Tax=Candidatus Nesciobacter abundans TaxID=2601668 RepID=A0A5C0UHJ6_9PROT|nr:glutamate--tRNA ligase [Candidatus Nesciobacter abundans]QEK39171.1 hypothetical protein FZC36_01870 [Candidatus Nesciobacter abundans]